MVDFDGGLIGSALTTSIQSIAARPGVPTFTFLSAQETTLEQVQDKVWNGDVWAAVWANGGQTEVSSLWRILLSIPSCSLCSISSYPFFFAHQPYVIESGLQQLPDYQRHIHIYGDAFIRSFGGIHLYRSPDPLLYSLVIVRPSRSPGGDRYGRWDRQHCAAVSLPRSKRVR